MNANDRIDLVCFSSLPWDFVFHRPQHLMSRFAKHFRVIYVEQPSRESGEAPVHIYQPAENIHVVRIQIPEGLPAEYVLPLQNERLAQVFAQLNIQQYFFWHYSPLALSFSDDLHPMVSVYDCTTEIPSIASDARALEDEFLKRADLVFTAGPSLHEAKRNLNQNTYCLPGSVDVDHFYGARYYHADPLDQSDIPHPRIGFSGIIDDRIDFQLLKAIAIRKPEWHLVLVGPLVSITEPELPQLPNIHFLGKKSYDQLPGYISGWDVTMLPFAHNDTTRYINPLQAPEFLAAGKPVISTPVIDVIRSYGNKGLIQIAGTADEFVRVAEIHLSTRDRTEWLESVADYLSLNSWDKTWQRMMDLTWACYRSKRQQRISEPIEKIYA